MNTRQYFKCLNDKSVMEAKVSDHHPVTHRGVLFWNVMMQCKLRKDGGYNNGFGIEEKEEQYIKRLDQIAAVISEIASNHPALDAICLCEGPIQSLHTTSFIHSLKQHQFISHFLSETESQAFFYQPDVQGIHQWGLLMLADKRFHVTALDFQQLTDNSFFRFETLANRFQIWQLMDQEGVCRYLALGHFPYLGNEQATDRNSLFESAHRYRDFVTTLLKSYADTDCLVCADFNINPYLISDYEDRVLDAIPVNNSVVLSADKKSTNTVTVDGILLSRLAKQRYDGSQANDRLFSRMQLENQLNRGINHRKTAANDDIFPLVKVTK